MDTYDLTSWDQFCERMMVRNRKKTFGLFLERLNFLTFFWRRQGNATAQRAHEQSLCQVKIRRTA